jgi:TolA-binding protein
MKRSYLIMTGCVVGSFLWGCTGDPDLGTRFQAERALWQTSMEAQRLNIRPDLVTDAQWHRVIDRFLAIPKDYPVKGHGPAAKEALGVEAHALMGAARIYATLGDSVAMLDLFRRLETEYRDLPDVTGDVALARGRIAENRSDWRGALAAYEEVLKRVEPRSGDPGVAGLAFDLPLRTARLRVMVAGDSTLAFRRTAYADAQTTYERLAAGPDTMSALDAHAYLAEVATDLNNWPEAESQLSQLETRLRSMNPPPKDPASARYALAQAQSQSKAPPETVRGTLESLVKDYPKSGFAPRALLSMALSFAQEGKLDQGLSTLQTLLGSYNEAEDVAAQAMLLKGQILERQDKWTEAQQVFNSLPVEHPVTESALLAPVEVIKHYERVGDKQAASAALTKAETAYRDFLSRYPTGPVSISAQEKLARTLAQEKRYDLAVAEFERLGEALGQFPQGATYLLAAAQMAVSQLGDTTRATQILDRTASLYPDRSVGRWASGEAARLRGTHR